MAYRADDVLADTDRIVSPELYEHYGKALRRSVDVTFTQDNGSGLSDRLRANASWFAAHKSAYVMQTLREIEADDAIQDKTSAKKMALKLFDRWMDAEVNTATARARTAKQFEEFMQPDNVRLFPNLRWIASRSADPRVSHTKFYDRVWAKTDPFWKTNAPGTEWNCKCDIEETDDPVTDNSGVSHHIPPRGLEGNPAETGQLFTENASYVRGTKGVPEIEIIRTARKTFQNRNKGIEIVSDTNIGRIVSDDISVRETCKGSATEQCFFTKQEIVLNVSHYADKLEYLRDEAVDLTHNSEGSMFLKKKRQFSVIKVYRLLLESKNYQGKTVQMDVIVKLGKFKSSGDFHLYSITG
jgi:hypothetical protein